MLALMAGQVTTIGQVGFTIAVGLLLDTFVVRSLLVPALATLLARGCGGRRSRVRLRQNRGHDPVERGRARAPAARAEQEIATSGPAGPACAPSPDGSGSPHQATAHHFEDRAGLFTAPGRRGIRAAAGGDRRRGRPRREDEVAAGAQVAASGAAYVEFALRHPTMFDVMFRPELLHHADDPRLLDIRALHRDHLVHTVAAAQAQAGAPPCPPRLAVVGWPGPRPPSCSATRCSPTCCDAAQLLRRVARRWTRSPERTL